MGNNIQITSEDLYLSSSLNSISMSANQDLTVYTGKGVIYTTGPYGSVDPNNSFIVKSQNIILGYPKDITQTQEAAVKSDQLINVLNKMLNLMNDIVNNPQEKTTITGQIKQLQKQLDKIKSTTTKLY